MVKCGKGKRIVLVVFICLCFSLTNSSGCKKKDQSEEVQKGVSVEDVTQKTTSEQIVWVEASEKIDLRILYVGQLNIERSKDFMEFLSKNFKKVTAVDKKGFDEDKTNEFDVILLDQIIRLKREYSRPTITIGRAGTKTGDYLDLKTGYL